MRSSCATTGTPKQAPYTLGMGSRERWHPRHRSGHASAGKWLKDVLTAYNDQDLVNPN